MSRKARIITIIVSTVLLLPLLLIMEENWRGKRAWEKTKRDLEAQGEHLDMAWFIPPRVPDEENLALSPVFSPMFSGSENPRFGDADAKGGSIAVDEVCVETRPQVGSVAMSWSWRTGLAQDLSAWQDFYRKEVKDVTLDKSPAEDVLTALARYDHLLAGLRDAVKARPVMHWPLNYNSGFEMSLQCYDSITNLERILAMRACAKLALGRTDDALADVELGFRLMESVKDDPLMIPGMLRLTWMITLMQPVWEGLESHRWTDAQLQKLEPLLLGYDWLAGYLLVMRSERAGINICYENMRSDPRNVIHMLASGGGWGEEGEDEQASVFLLRFTRLFPGILYQNQASYNRLIQEKFLPGVNVAAHRVDVQVVNQTFDYVTNVQNFGPYSRLNRSSFRASRNLSFRYAQIQTYVEMAAVVCEIERYQLAHGALPATRADLHMQRLPHDVIDGQPLRYRVTGDDYMLYSIGWNAVDDGGKTATVEGSSAFVRESDWVWPRKTAPKTKR